MQLYFFIFSEAIMEQTWNLSIWGVRGSLPAAEREFMEYGGNTSCFSVACGDDLVVFDAGSGIQQLAAHLGGHTRIHIFLSHVHIDHLLGLFAFAPLHSAAAELHLYGEPRGDVSLRRQLETLIGPPYWPLGLDDFKARLVLHEIAPGQQISLPGGETVRTLRGCHPNESILFRLEDSRHSVVYALDCELTGAVRPALLDFCRDAQLLIWDASFTRDDLARCRGWGHSSWEQGLEMRREAHAGQVLMTHYSQHYTDKFLQEQETLARQSGEPVCFAKERMVIAL